MRKSISLMMFVHFMESSNMTKSGKTGSLLSKLTATRPLEEKSGGQS